MTTDFSPVNWNMPDGNTVMEVGIYMVVRLIQLEKIEGPNPVTEVGIFTDTSLVLFAKRDEGSEVMEVGMITLTK